MWTRSLPGSDGRPGVPDEPSLWLSARGISTARSPASKSRRRGGHVYCRWSPNCVNGLPPAAGSLNPLEKSPCCDSLCLKWDTLGMSFLKNAVHHVFHFESAFSLCLHLEGRGGFARTQECVCVNLGFPVWHSQRSFPPPMHAIDGDSALTVLGK